MAASVALELTQSLLTNGARAAAVLMLQACFWVAIPQLSKDIPSEPPSLHGGDHDVSLLLYRSNPKTNQLEEFQQLSVPGGEDAEFFTVDDRLFLATATIGAGKGESTTFDVESCIFEWNGRLMEKFQCIPTSGAKQWRGFELSGRHFLALAQGLEDIPGVDIPKRNSTIYEWKGDRFEPFQILSSLAGYNWLRFSIQGREFLAYADHVEPSRVMEWDGERFVNFQAFNGDGGRAFSFYRRNNQTYLAFARVGSDSVVYQWDGNRFREFQTLPGPGGRELTTIDDGTSLFLARVNFIAGSREDPTTALNSTIYRIDSDGSVHSEVDFPTFGGTDVKTFQDKGETYLIVTNSLTKEVRFRQDSHVYRFVSDKSPTKGENKTISKPQLQVAKRQVDPNPAFGSLFSAYTGGPDSLGFQFRTAITEAQASSPLIVCTSAYILIYPGNGQDPSMLPFRLQTKGFVELTSISHIGPAIATLAQMKALNKEWKSHAQNLLNATQAVKGANSESFWRDFVGGEAFVGREASIAAMTNYACDMTIHFLRTVLADPNKLTSRFVQETFLEAGDSRLNATTPAYNTTLPAWNGTISFNKIMIATFFLNGLDTAYRLQNWLNQYNIDWANAQVLITGQAGRPSAGVTLSTNSMVGVLAQSFPEFPLERLYIAPHGPTPDIQNGTADSLLQYEEQFRGLWGALLGYAELGAEMFVGYPAYKIQDNVNPIINSSTTAVSELPKVMAPDDWLSMVTRLRVTLEDARQTLSSCVADYAAQQLYENNFDLEKVNVAGLDGYDYVSGRAKA